VARLLRPAAHTAPAGRWRRCAVCTHGIGPVKLGKYADAILEAVKDEYV
jgi:hypothetical protein